MPIVDIWGFPNDTPQELLETLVNDLQHTVAGIEELGVKAEQVTIRVLKDLVELGLGEEVNGRVQSLFDKPPGDKPERTPEVCQKLNCAIGNVLAEFATAHLPDCRLVEMLPVDLVEYKRGDHMVFELK